MQLHLIDTGNFKLDGGAMFGVVPKSIWERSYPADDHNRCSWSMRCLLVEDGDRLLLIDTGIGDKQSEKFFAHYCLFGEGSLVKSIQKAGFSTDDVTDVLLTHLHFDHCGGAVQRSGSRLELTFKNAVYWSNERHWKWATAPNRREQASFLRENILPIEESGQLQFVAREGDRAEGVFDHIDLLFVDGHTEAQQLPVIQYKDQTVVFAADLLPSASHIPLPYIMGYDTRPLTTLKEKEAFLKKAADERTVLFLQHDYFHQCCTVKHTEKGVRLDQTFELREIL